MLVAFELSRSSSVTMPNGMKTSIVVPSPSALSIPIRPPISPTIWLTMASPRPVPPNFRVIELSSWVKASKIDA